MCLLSSVEFLCLAWRNDAMWFLCRVLKSVSLSPMYVSGMLKSEAIHETGLSGNVVASFFHLKIFIPLCFNVLSTVPRENRLTDSPYLSFTDEALNGETFKVLNRLQTYLPQEGTSTTLIRQFND